MLRSFNSLFLPLDFAPCTAFQEKGPVTPQETDPDLPRGMCRSLQQRHGLAVACCRAGGTECSSACIRLLKEVAIIFITSTIVCPKVNNREGTQPHPSTENWIKDLLSMSLPIRRPSFPFSQSCPSGSFHKPLILLHQRADRLKTRITEN